MPRCKKRKPKHINSSSDIFGKQDANKDFFAPRYSGRFKTVCDVNVHPDDGIKFALGKAVRHVGTGIPKVVTLSGGEGMASSHPCHYEVAMEHEKVHVDNAMANCEGFKKCLDDEVANNWVNNTVSVAEFKACEKTHHGGLKEDCVLDEKAAYQKSVEVGERLVTESRCAAEKSNLETNITLWKEYAKVPPNC